MSGEKIKRQADLDPFSLDRRSLPMLRTIRDILKTLIFANSGLPLDGVGPLLGDLAFNWIRSFSRIMHKRETDERSVERNLFDVGWFLILESSSRSIECDSSMSKYHEKAFKEALILHQELSRNEGFFGKCSMSNHMVWLFHYILVLMRSPNFFDLFCKEQGVSSTVEITKKIVLSTGNRVMISTSGAFIMILLLNEVTDINPKAAYHPDIIPLFAKYLDQNFMIYSSTFSKMSRKVILLMFKIICQLSLAVSKARDQTVKLSLMKILRKYSPGVHYQLDELLINGVNLFEKMEVIHRMEIIVKNEDTEEELLLENAGEECAPHEQGVPNRQYLGARPVQKLSGVVEVTDIHLSDLSEDEDIFDKETREELSVNKGDIAPRNGAIVQTVSLVSRTKRPQEKALPQDSKRILRSNSSKLEQECLG